LTFVASANPILYQGGRPVLVDSEDESLNIDPDLVVEELERRRIRGIELPKAIEVVHLLGHPARIDPIVAIANELGISVVEDASEALGATYRDGHPGKFVGTIGRVGCFSFNGNKLITTGGGGMVVTDDPDLAAHARFLSTQARRPGRIYWHDEVGYNYRLSNIAAALGLSQLEMFDGLLAGRRRNAARYDEGIATISWLRPAARAPWADPSFWLYTARIAAGGPPRDAILDSLGASGIEARPIWTPLHRMPLFRDAPLLRGEVADAIFDSGVSLPSSSHLTESDAARVIMALHGAGGGATAAVDRDISAATVASDAASGSRDPPLSQVCARLPQHSTAGFGGTSTISTSGRYGWI
jgi:dTDP-4-amino-4,6-dideoxygalactose transaminase